MRNILAVENKYGVSEMIRIPFLIGVSVHSSPWPVTTGPVT